MHQAISESCGSAAHWRGQLLAGAALAQEDTIKVGILHSLSGTMAISETTLKDVMLMLIDEQNAKGGLLGKQLEPVVVDPASDWPLFAEKARELIANQQVAVVFGCWTSVSRKSVLPVFEELNSILFYPVQYEGQESQRNVFYTGAAPNQQAIPAVDYLMNEEGVERWVLAGTDYVYPRTTNQILEAYLKSKGVARRGHHDQLHAVRAFRLADDRRPTSRRSAPQGKKTAVVSTINGDANVPFYKELGNQGISAEDIPVVAFSVGEEELAGLDTKPLVGHLAAWNYFRVDRHAGERRRSSTKWHAFTKNDDRTTNDPMEAHYIGFNMWVKAVEAAGTTDTDAVIEAMNGVAVPNLTGGISSMSVNHHITKPVLHRRDPRRRPVRHGVADQRPGARRRVVGLPAGVGGSHRQLAGADVLRQLQRQDRRVRRRDQLMRERAGPWPAPRVSLSERPACASSRLFFSGSSSAARAIAQPLEELIADAAGGELLRPGDGGGGDRRDRRRARRGGAAGAVGGRARGAQGGRRGHPRHRRRGRRRDGASTPLTGAGARAGARRARPRRSRSTTRFAGRSASAVSTLTLMSPDPARRMAAAGAGVPDAGPRAARGDRGGAGGGAGRRRAGRRSRRRGRRRCCGPTRRWPTGWRRSASVAAQRRRARRWRR